MLEAHAIGHACCLGIGLCLLDEGSEVVVAHVVRLWVGLSQLDQGLSLPTADIRYLCTTFQFRQDIRHSWQPHWHQQILKPTAGKACYSFPGAWVVGFHWDATPAAEGLHQLVDRSGQTHYFLLNPPEEDRSPFLREDRNVLGGEREATSCRVVLQIASACHCAEPLASIAFVNVRTLGQLFTRGWSLLRQDFEETKTVADAGHHSYGKGSGISQHLTYKCIGFRLIDRLLRCHVFSPLSVCILFICAVVICLMPTVTSSMPNKGGFSIRENRSFLRKNHIDLRREPGMVKQCT